VQTWNLFWPLLTGGRWGDQITTHYWKVVTKRDYLSEENGEIS
jgi:hypothetical protein